MLRPHSTLTSLFLSHVECHPKGLAAICQALRAESNAVSSFSVNEMRLTNEQFEDILSSLKSSNGKLAKLELKQVVGVPWNLPSIYRALWHPACKLIRIDVEDMAWDVVEPQVRWEITEMIRSCFSRVKYARLVLILASPRELSRLRKTTAIERLPKELLRAVLLMNL